MHHFSADTKFFKKQFTTFAAENVARLKLIQNKAWAGHGPMTAI